MKILIVVDMQHDFIDGSLGTEEAQKILPYVETKIESYRSCGDTVVFTRDTHEDNYLETQEGKNLPVKHCIKGTEGHQIHKKLTVTKTDIVIDKKTFGSLDLIEVIKELQKNTVIEEIELIGLCTDICVISNAFLLKAAFTEILISCDSSCCAGVTPESHHNALSAMKMCQINVK